MKRLANPRYFLFFSPSTLMIYILKTYLTKCALIDKFIRWWKKLYTLQKYLIKCETLINNKIIIKTFFIDDNIIIWIGDKRDYTISI